MSRVQYSTVEYQYSTVEYSRVQYSTKKLGGGRGGGNNLHYCEKKLNEIILHCYLNTLIYYLNYQFYNSMKHSLQVWNYLLYSR